MMVTRQRPRRHRQRALIPLALIAVIAGALTWPPSQRLIANGPLKPVLSLAGGAFGGLSRPLTFAAQQQTIADRNREIRDLNVRLERQRQAKADADARAQQLAQQLSAVANRPQPAPVLAVRATPSAGFGGTAAREPAGSGEEKRVAATWAAMEPEKSAAVAQRLPEAQVARILSQMDAESAGAIMNALPAGVAARISRAVAQVQPGFGR